MFIGVLVAFCLNAASNLSRCATVLLLLLFVCIFCKVASSPALATFSFEVLVSIGKLLERTINYKSARTYFYSFNFAVVYQLIKLSMPNIYEFFALIYRNQNWFCIVIFISHFNVLYNSGMLKCVPTNYDDKNEALN